MAQHSTTVQFMKKGMISRNQFVSNTFVERGRRLAFIWLVLPLATLFYPCAAQGGNLLVNPGFEANSGHAIPVGWTRFAPPTAQPFGNYWIESNVPAHGGTLYWKQWGAVYNAAVTNVAGLFQDFSSAPGSSYQASGWFYTRTSDVLGADCVTWIEVSFLGASSNLLALYKSPNFNAAAGVDTWLPYQVTEACDPTTPVPSGDPYFATYAVTGTVSQLTAPVGTKTVRYLYAYSQAGSQGGSAYFDDAVLDQVGGPLPPVISNVSPLNMIFVNPADGITFTASSPSGFTINASDIRLVVNGVDVSSSLAISGSASNKTVGYFGLKSNLTYTATITVTDAFGFSASTDTFFETTWLGIPPIVYLWEAEDYDFSGGQYFNNPDLCNTAGNPNCYYGTAGIEGVDYHKAGGANSHLYRPEDAVSIGVSGDLLRKNLVAAGRTDYRIDPFNSDEWLNYSRDWSNGTYWVFARLATGEGLAGSLTLGMVNADTTVTDLGTFTISNGRGWTSYDNVPLRDSNGNLAVVTLNGKSTLRVTSGGNLLPNFFMLTAAQLDLPLLSGLYPTGTNAFEYTNTLSFKVATVGATFPADGIRLILDGSDVSQGLLITGTDAAKNVVYPTLLPNAVHKAVITATNSLGHGISVTNEFDTFSQDNYMVEAEDFDYDGGRFVHDWQPGSYFGLGATTNVDYQHTVIDPTAEQSAFPYRTQGIPQAIARDYLRQKFLDSGATDYHLDWFGGGDWANYTREYPTNSFYAYVRSGGFGSYSMDLEEVVSGAGTTAQVTRSLGRWSGTGRDSQTHAWVRLTDPGAVAPAVVQLAGLATLRLSTSTGNCHPSFFMLIPAVATPVAATVSGNGVSISFPTQAGVTYRVFYRDSLAAGDWQLLTTVGGNGSTQSVNDPVTGSQRYYKVSAP
jgi:hypothetical protein